MKAAYVLAFFLLNACTYNTYLRGFDYAATPHPNLQGKTVAVVVDKSLLQDGHTTRSDVYKFKFNDVIEGVTEALRSRIGRSAQKTDIVQAEDLKGGAYQVLVYPQVKARSVNDFWTMGCLIDFGLEIRDGKDNRVIAKESGQGKRNFFSANQFDEKCKVAMTEVFNKVTDRALPLIR